MPSFWCCCRALFVMLFAGAALVVAQVKPERTDSDRARLADEERLDYFRKWLEEAAVYIISPEEKQVFQQLTTPEEKTKFIEQFWKRRDPDLRTEENEFKAEHYRRIAYANERFKSGKPGWKTDRGKIYIIHGPPDQIEKSPAGGTYERTMAEGGGFTSTFPFEKWWYRYIPGMGSDIEIEFVDPSGSNEYRISLDPAEKDALLYAAGTSPTLAEQMGLASHADRPFFTGDSESYPVMNHRIQDVPFRRYERLMDIHRPEPIRYDDLKKLVEVHVTFDSLPFAFRIDFLRLNDQAVLVPLTVEVPNRELSFKLENGVHRAHLTLYGALTSLTGELVTEFDDDLFVSFPPQQLGRGLQQRSIYQKLIPLHGKMRYKLDLVIKDSQSGKTGVISRAVVPPFFKQEGLVLSSLILSDMIQPLSESVDGDEMFVLGNLKVRPRLSKSFAASETLGLYLQVYNAALDQARLAPSLSATYRITQKGKIVREILDESGASIQFFSSRRVILTRKLRLNSFPPGDFKIEVLVEDQITGEKSLVEDHFAIVAEGDQLAVADNH